MKVDIDFKEDEYGNQTCCIFRFKELTLDLEQKLLIIVKDDDKVVRYHLDEIDRFDVWEEVVEE